MGNGKVYQSGGFTGTNAKYESVGDYKYANGLKGCIVKRKDDGDFHSNSMPLERIEVMTRGRVMENEMSGKKLLPDIVPGERKAA